jgi:LmbE family N-acetylglucosaminyl deacetylase
MVICAHPDDEVIGVGGRLPRLGRAVTIVHTTDGAPRDGRDARASGCAGRADYAAERGRELDAAMSLAGIETDQLYGLGLADQAASFHLVEMSRRVAWLIGQLRPELVVTHPYEGGHPDHDATAFTVHAACGLLRGAGERAPGLAEMTSYHDEVWHTGGGRSGRGGWSSRARTRRRGGNRSVR